VIQKSFLSSSDIFADKTFKGIVEVFDEIIESFFLVFNIFLTYFGVRFGIESRKRTEALNKLELILAKEHELESIGLQAAAAAHSLGTPLSTITVIARELEKEIGNNPKYSRDIDLLLSQTKRCSDILKNLSKDQKLHKKFNEYENSFSS